MQMSRTRSILQASVGLLIILSLGNLAKVGAQLPAHEIPGSAGTGLNAKQLTTFTRLAESTPDWTATIDQQDAQLGYALSTAGDVNGDGYSDLVVGAPWYDGGQTDEGAAFVFYGSASGLESAPGWSAEGDQGDAHFGSAVSIAGDVDGDGYADVVIGAPDYDGGQTDEGAAYVYYGGPDGLTEGPADWVETGGQGSAHYGAAVATAGDVDGDGYSDLIVGAPDYNGGETGEGAAFLYHGSSGGLTIGTADWTRAGGQAEAHFGAAVGAAGDVDGDGYADVIVGAPGYDVTGGETIPDAGRATVWHGGPDGLTEGPAGWTASGDQEDGHLGAAVSTAGDVDGDGYTDVIIGAPDYDGGAAFVYHGGADGLMEGAADWTETGEQAEAHFGAAVASAGDLDGDGYADVVVGAPDRNTDQSDAGAAYVYHGGPGGLAESAAGWSTSGSQQGAHLGSAVSAAGDMDGDGHGDLAVGASGYDDGQTDEGGAFVYRGRPDGLSTAPAWDSVGPDDSTLIGWTVGTAGDVDGDGFDEVLVGAPRYDDGETEKGGPPEEGGPLEEGVVFLYAGGPGGPATSATAVLQSDQQYAWFGMALGPAGDVNGDGHEDVIVGAPRYDGEERDEGAAFVYHGGPTGLITTTAWLVHPTDQADARFGAAVASAGDVDGDGYGDVIVTANGYDGEAANEGAAFVYHGGPDGLAAEPAWTVHPTDQDYANFGRSAASAGDLNRDGYSDVIVGAPWYDVDQTDEGRNWGMAFVYHGSETGLGSEPDWTAADMGREAKLGIAVSTAGDVNGDGYSDVLCGAYQYTEAFYVTPWREGAAIVYHGGPEGLDTGSGDWIVRSGQKESKFALSVSTAGDVNGDGYADLVVGAPNYDDGEPQEGFAFTYHGSPSGLEADPVWSVEGDQRGAAFGFSVSTAGDVNGDGYGDVIVGAPTYNSVWIDEGAAFVYLGNGGGLPVRLRQVQADQDGRGDGSAPIAPLGRSGSDQVQLELIGRSPLGRAWVGFEWQLAPLGVPFTATTAISGTSPAWTDALTTGVALSQTVGGLAGETVYRWRARLRYPVGNALGQVSGRWLYPRRNGPGEGDFRTGEVSGTLTVAGSVAIERPQAPQGGAQVEAAATPTSGMGGSEVIGEVTVPDSLPTLAPATPFLPLTLRDMP